MTIQTLCDVMQASPCLQESISIHQEAIRGFVASRLGCGADADDIAQQTLLQAIANVASFRGDNPRAWLFSIARRLIIDLYRDRGYASFVPVEEDSTQRAEAALQTSATSVQSHCEARERIRCCLDCIRTIMPPVEQVAILMADIHGFTDSESAVRLRMSVTAFKFMLHKARARLHAAASFERTIEECALVSKTGVEMACPGGARDSGGTKNAGDQGDTRRSGLDDTALTALRRELVDALTFGHDRQPVSQPGGRLRDSGSAGRVSPDVSGLSFRHTGPSTTVTARHADRMSKIGAAPGGVQNPVRR